MPMGEGTNNKTMVVHWIEPGSRETQDYSHLLHAVHPDPTAERAIGNILREERREKRKAARKAERKEARRAKRRELALSGKSPGRNRRRKKPTHPRTLVWRAEDEEKASRKNTEGGGSLCGSP